MVKHSLSTCAPAAISKICHITFYKQHLHRNCIVLIHAWKLLIEIGSSYLLQKISVNFNPIKLKLFTMKDICMVCGSMVFDFSISLFLAGKRRHKS